MAPSFVLAKKNVTDDGCGDRFSDLSDSIIHHIFSFLYMNEFVCLAVLSKRFRKVCLSNPYIYLTLSTKSTDFKENWRPRTLVDRYFHQKNGYTRHGTPLWSQCISPCKDFYTFMNNIMSQRGDCSIRSFHLELTMEGCSCGHIDGKTLNAWLHEAAKCKIEELYLNISIDFPDQTPFFILHSLFGSNCLRVLDLDFHQGKFELPSTVLGSLETLSMNCLCFSGELPVGEWISTHCKSLKKLSLLYIKDLNLESHSIEELTIIPIKGLTQIVVSCINLRALSLDIQTFSHRGYDWGKKPDHHIQVSAPNLEVLSCGGSPNRLLDFGVFSRLKAATLNRCRDNDANLSCLGHLFSLVKLLSSATVLSVPLCITEVLFLKDEEPLMFENLQRLVIRGDEPRDLKKYHKFLITDLIRHSPNLASLTIEIKKEGNSGDHNSWESDVEKLIAKKARGYNWKTGKISPQLKEVTIKLFGSDNYEKSGMEFVNHFIEAAPGLEKITIFYKSSCFDKLSTVLDRAIRGSGRSIKVATHVKEVELVFYQC